MVFPDFAGANLGKLVYPDKKLASVKPRSVEKRMKEKIKVAKVFEITDKAEKEQVKVEF